MNDTLMTVFVALTCAAVLMQAGILLALFLSVKKTSARVESLANQVESRALPLLDSAKMILEQTGPQIREISANMADVSETIRSQVTRIDATVSDLTESTRQQAMRVNDLVTRTIDKVEETTDIVQHTIIAPVRQISGIVQGLSVGVNAYLSRRGKMTVDAAGSVEDEELFI